MRQLPLVLLGLATTAFAQSTFTSPVGLADIEGNGISANAFPSFAGSRVQYLDGNQRGTARPNIRALRLRRDSSQPPVATMTARTLDLSIVMAHCNQAAASTTFANNYLNAQSTNVYTMKPTNLPNLVTQGPFPAPFTQFQVMFDVMFSYNGTDDLLWETASRNNATATVYYFDHATNGSIAGGGSAGFAFLGGVGCVVPPSTTPWIIQAAGAGTSATNVVTVQYYTTANGPISSPAALALGISDPNFQGPLCAPLRTSADIVLPMSTSATGQIGTSTAPLTITFPFPGSLPVELYSQFAGVDVPNSRLYLTDATYMSLRPYSTPTTRACTAVRVFGATADTAPTGAVSTFCMVGQFVY